MTKVTPADLFGAMILESLGLEAIAKDERHVKITKADDEKRLVYGIVVEPMTDVTDDGDAHGDRMTAEEIEKSAHGFMIKSQNMKLGHEGNAISSDVVESYIAPVDFTMGEQEIKKGTWVLVTKVNHEGVWKAIKKGIITGYSPGGFGIREDYDSSINGY